MTNLLPEALRSSLLGWLAIAFLFSASVVTYFKRIDQFKKTGALPIEASSAPTWLFNLFAFVELAVKVALIVLNWQFGLILYALGFALATMGVLETVGSLVMFPFLRTPLPDMSFDAAAGDNALMQEILLPAKKRHFAAKLLWVVAWYIAISLLINAVHKDASTVFKVSLTLLAFFLYLYIFALCGVRASESRRGISLFIIFLGILGRVNDYELIIIPIVVLATLIISAKQRLPEPIPEAESSTVGEKP